MQPCERDARLERLRGVALVAPALHPVVDLVQTLAELEERGAAARRQQRRDGHARRRRTLLERVARLRTRRRVARVLALEEVLAALRLELELGRPARSPAVLADVGDDAEVVVRQDRGDLARLELLALRVDRSVSRAQVEVVVVRPVR